MFLEEGVLPLGFLGLDKSLPSVQDREYNQNL